MIELLRRISIDNKLRLLSLIPLFFLLLVSGVFVARSYDDAIQGRKIATKQTVEAALAIVDWAHSLEKNGEVSKEKAQQMALQALNRARYAGNEYFWVNDMNHNMVMHPTKPELNGKNLADMKDPSGTPLFVRFVDTVRTQKAGYVQYMWPKPGQDQPVAKISYVVGFEPWGWVVGSGVYVDDLKSAFYENAGTLALVLAAAIVACVILGRVVGGQPG